MCLWMSVNSMEDPFTSTPTSTPTSTTTSSIKPTAATSSSSSIPRTASDFYEMGVQEARRMTTTPTSSVNRNDDNDGGQSYGDKNPMQDMQLVIQQALAMLQTGIIVSSFPLL